MEMQSFEPQKSNDLIPGMNNVVKKPRSKRGE